MICGWLSDSLLLFSVSETSLTVGFNVGFSAVFNVGLLVGAIVGFDVGFELGLPFVSQPKLKIK